MAQTTATMAELRIRNVPDDHYWLFKAAAAEERKSINDKLIELIEEYLKQKGKI